MNPVNSFTFPSNKTATQSHSQANMLFWLDFLCDNLVYPCNTPSSVLVDDDRARREACSRAFTVRGGLSTVRFAQWRAFLPHSGLQPRPNAVIPASCGRDQGKHPLQVPGHGHEVPLPANMIEPAQQELAETEHGLDDTEDRFRNVLALGVELPALQRLQAMGHGLDRRRIVRRGRRLGEARAQGGMVALAAQGDQRR